LSSYKNDCNGYLKLLKCIISAKRNFGVIIIHVIYLSFQKKNNILFLL
jgi:hypothetical protein